MENIYEKIAKKHGTPFYLFDVDKFQMQIEKVATAFEICDLCYCVKANPFLIPFISKSVSLLEVCSHGEFELCRHYLIESYKIFYTGVYKKADEIKEALLYGVYKFSCESIEQFKILVEVAEVEEKDIQVYLRYGEHNQFGLNRDEILSIIKNNHSERICITGIHYFERSQKRKVEKIRQEIEEINWLCTVIQKECNFVVSNVEYGLGLDADYFSDNPQKEMDVLLEMASMELNKWNTTAHITIEMGRFLAASCGYYVSKVVDVKKKGTVNFAILDGGSHQMHYDGQMMGMKMPIVTNINGIKEMYSTWTLCGALCTYNDVFVRNIKIKDLKIEDILVFEFIGAYSVTEGMAMFLTRDIPPVFMKGQEMGIICARNRINTNLLNSINALL